MKSKTHIARPFLPGTLCIILLLAAVSIFGSKAAAQNLIPNPSFESRDSCPSGWHEGFPFVSGGVAFADDWYMPSAGTADYYNTCAPSGFIPGFLYVWIPSNMFGYQYARTGQAYAGGLVENQGNEYVETPLSLPTVANHRYFISYWINMANNSAGACNLFGAYASVDSVEMQNEVFLDMLTPQVESPVGTIFTDSVNWMQVAGSYISPGNERWLTIGNFHTPAEQDTVQFFENMGFGFGPMYYYYDDVCMLDLDGTPSDFTLADTTLCGAATITLTGRTDKHNYFWNDGSTGASMVVNAPGTYWVKSIDVNTCNYAIDTIRIAGGAAAISLGRDTSICYNQTITLKATNESFERFEWNTGAVASSIEVTKPGTYSVTAFSECAVGTDTIKVSLSGDCNCLFIPNAFSPNSDGLNDNLTVSNLCPVGFFVFNIYNRFGERIFTSNNPSQAWDGLYKGKECDQGTYFYNIHYGSKDNASSEIRELKGDIALLR